jgi:uncharacterized membrane protein YfcA
MREFRALLWLARFAGLLLTLFVVIIAALFLFNPHNTEGPPPSSWPTEWPWLGVFPFGVCLGYLVGWWRPLVGSVVSLTCLLFGLLLPEVPLQLVSMIVFLVPAVLFLLYAVAKQKGPAEGTAA